MKDVNLNADAQGSVQSLIDPAYDPVYGPTSKYLWPGGWVDAQNYVLSPTHPPDYVSGEEFLEIYEEDFSGVSDSLESTDYPKRGYSDTLYDCFHRLYSHVESWDRTALFVSAVYRGIFHEMRPYESRLLELRTDLDYESIWENYLKEGRKDEALAAYGAFVKEDDKRKRDLSVSTCADLLNLILSSYTDIPLISELIKVLHRTNIVVNHQQQLQEGLLFKLEGKRQDCYYLHGLPPLVNEKRRDRYREKLVLSLSLLQIDSNAVERAVDDSFSSRSYEPITRLIRDHPSFTL